VFPVPKIGEFELLVVLAILRQRDTPFANEIRRDLVDNARRSVTRGALYRTLDRLKAKGMVQWASEPDTDATRGGNPGRRLRVTAKGLRAVRESRAILLDFFEGADPALG
jgi:DNA-binding PadR family transcriptional regulator